MAALFPSFHSDRDKSGEAAQETKHDETLLVKKLRSRKRSWGSTEARILDKKGCSMERRMADFRYKWGLL